MSDVVLWDVEDGIAVCTINRPKALNALNAAVLDGLAEVFRGPAHEAGIRAIVLRGAGDKAFVAGADIVAMQEMTPAEAEAFAGKSQILGDLIEACPVPVIAAIQGFALGGGCEIAMACDILVAGPKARFGQPEVNLGVIPGFGGTQRLTRLVGMAKAMDLVLTGRMIGAEEAERIGLVSRVVEGDAFEAAKGVAAEIAKKGPVAVRLARRAVRENADADLRTGLAAERSLFALCFATDDQTEGMKAFVEKRAANWSGR